MTAREYLEEQARLSHVADAHIKAAFQHSDYGERQKSVEAYWRVRHDMNVLARQYAESLQQSTAGSASGRPAAS